VKQTKTIGGAPWVVNMEKGTSYTKRFERGEKRHMGGGGCHFIKRRRIPREQWEEHLKGGERLKRSKGERWLGNGLPEREGGKKIKVDSVCNGGDEREIKPGKKTTHFAEGVIGRGK